MQCFLRCVRVYIHLLYCFLANFTVVFVSIPQVWKSAREVVVWTSQREATMYGTQFNRYHVEIMLFWLSCS